MPKWWERVGKAAGNVAAYGAAPLTGGMSLLGKKDVRDAAGGFLNDPVGTVKGAYEWASGAQDTQKAMEQQQAGIAQAGGAIGDAYKQGQGLLSPYQQGGAQNFQDFSSKVRSGAFNPQFQGYQGPMASGGQFTPQFQGYNGQMSSNVQAPNYQQYQGQMSSGNTLPEFQQFQGAGMPQRQQGTAENVNMFMDPGHKFRMEQGLGAVQSRLAGRGLVGSGAEMKGLNDYAQGMASQEFGNAYGRFQDGQNNMMNDARDTRNFGYGMNQDMNNFNAQNSDRAQSRFEGDRAAGLQNNQFANNFGMGVANFQQSAFEGDRAAGLGYNQTQNQFGLNRANFQQGAFEGDRAAGMQGNQFQNNFNMQNGQNAYNQWSGLANMGYDAATQGANMATNYGANMAGLFGDAANARAQATMTQSQQNRGLFRDIVNVGARAYGAG